MSYTIITASGLQIEKLYSKHLMNGLQEDKNKFSFDSEDNIGFVTLVTKTGKTFQYQLRNGVAMFATVIGFGNVRYDIDYDDDNNAVFYNTLSDIGKVLNDNFWAASEI